MQKKTKFALAARLAAILAREWLRLGGLLENVLCNRASSNSAIIAKPDGPQSFRFARFRFAECATTIAI